MKHIIYSAFLFVSTFINAQENSLIKAPKIKSLETGYYFIPNSTYSNMSTHGVTVLFDYAWQLSGYTSYKKVAFISVPLGYTYLFKNINDTASQTTRILAYGWTVRHNLAKDKQIIPFLGYGLLLNQLSFNNVKGRTFGHQTRFDFGLDFNCYKLTQFIKIEYSFTRYPTLGISKNEIVHSVSLKYGFRF